ncbi:hypothetical protein, conserved [Eimeria acervulina]|uniref:Uncharacterized protein n=1 Tax=Eimeria acervulina TaxID=5801 RepID=U6GB37_EIMAC|nr:hypothetical protein, conserved [Eimeria acervulina]CDI76742.1 hypothetical protein, conserved [Eimeria acervulina]
MALALLASLVAAFAVLRCAVHLGRASTVGKGLRALAEGGEGIRKDVCGDALQAPQEVQDEEEEVPAEDELLSRAEAVLSSLVSLTLQYEELLVRSPIIRQFGGISLVLALPAQELSALAVIAGEDLMPSLRRAAFVIHCAAQRLTYDPTLQVRSLRLRRRQNALARILRLLAMLKPQVPTISGSERLQKFYGLLRLQEVGIQKATVAYEGLSGCYAFELSSQLSQCRQALSELFKVYHRRKRQIFSDCHLNWWLLANNPTNKHHALATKAFLDKVANRGVQPFSVSLDELLSVGIYDQTRERQWQYRDCSSQTLEEDDFHLSESGGSEEEEGKTFELLDDEGPLQQDQGQQHEERQHKEQHEQHHLHLQLQQQQKRQQQGHHQQLQKQQSQQKQQQEQHSQQPQQQQSQQQWRQQRMHGQWGRQQLLQRQLLQQQLLQQQFLPQQLLQQQLLQQQLLQRPQAWQPQPQQQLLHPLVPGVVSVPSHVRSNILRDPVGERVSAHVPVQPRSHLRAQTSGSFLPFLGISGSRSSFSLLPRSSLSDALGLNVPSYGSQGLYVPPFEASSDGHSFSTGGSSPQLLSPTSETAQELIAGEASDVGLDQINLVGESSETPVVSSPFSLPDIGEEARRPFAAAGRRADGDM